MSLISPQQAERRNGDYRQEAYCLNHSFNENCRADHFIYIVTTICHVLPPCCKQNVVTGYEGSRSPCYVLRNV
jgi:hypothetical protein